MKKLSIAIIIIIFIIGIYLFVKKPSVQAPTIQDQAQIENLSTADTEAITEEMMNGMEGMTEQDIMGRGQTSAGEKIIKHAVNYTDSGFSPSSLQIKVGETVQFVNQSSGGMWVGSGPHPSHTAYPEFDAKKSISSGGIYEFAFTKVGEWKYHNHTKSSAFGTIIVK